MNWDRDLRFYNLFGEEFYHHHSAVKEMKYIYSVNDKVYAEVGKELWTYFYDFDYSAEKKIYNPI